MPGSAGGWDARDEGVHEETLGERKGWAETGRNDVSISASSRAQSKQSTVQAEPSQAEHSPSRAQSKKSAVQAEPSPSSTTTAATHGLVSRCDHNDHIGRATAPPAAIVTSSFE